MMSQELVSNNIKMIKIVALNEVKIKNRLKTLKLNLLLFRRNPLLEPSKKFNKVRQHVCFL